MNYKEIKPQKICSKEQKSFEDWEEIRLIGLQDAFHVLLELGLAYQ